jgi:hypothetical protein
VRLYAFSCTAFVRDILMGFLAIWAVTSFAYEISFFLALMRFFDEISCLSAVEFSFDDAI